MTFAADYVSTLTDHMDYVLGIIVDTFGQAGIGLPDRKYTTFATAVHDCEQLTVQFVQMYMGPPGDQAQVMQRCDALRSVHLLIDLARCIPTGNRGMPPTDEQMDAFAAIQGADAWMLLEAATKVSLYGVLADVAITEAQGGIQAVTLSLSTVIT